LPKAEKDARILLVLLRKYCHKCHLWEDHLTQSADGDFADREDEEECFKILQREHNLPLMQECVDKGYQYVQLMAIMPPPFKTTYDERNAILEDIENMVEQEYERI